MTEQPVYSAITRTEYKINKKEYTYTKRERR